MEGKKTIKVPPLCLGMFLGTAGHANLMVQVTDAVVGRQRSVRRVFWINLFWINIVFFCSKSSGRSHSQGNKRKRDVNEWKNYKLIVACFSLPVERCNIAFLPRCGAEWSCKSAEAQGMAAVPFLALPSFWVSNRLTRAEASPPADERAVWCLLLWYTGRGGEEALQLLSFSLF